jgi:hypothetical protein
MLEAQMLTLLVSVSIAIAIIADLIFLSFQFRRIYKLMERMADAFEKFAR